MAQLTEFQFRNMGCVVSSCPTASAIGKRILNDGGNAVDAAVAVALALTVTYPQAGNIGGGGFMLVHRASGEDYFLDYRETAPRNFKIEELRQDRESTVFGARSVCVPGTIAGLAEALKRFGTWSWDRIVSLCIPLADSGVWVSSRQGLAYQIYRDELERFESTRDCFLPHGVVPATGTLHSIPQLAQTFRTLAEEGPEAFYKGRIAQMIVDEVQRNAGFLEMEDMATYAARWREPIRTKFRNHDLITAPLPSAGGFIITKTLSLLEAAGAFDLPSNHPQRLVLLARAFRVAFWLRREVAFDPDYMDARQAELVNEAWMRKGSLDELERDLPAVPEPFSSRSGPNRSTTHYCVLDREGNTVSNTYSLNTLFGSKLAVRQAGFLLNSSIDDFSLSDSHVNWYQLVEGKENLLRPSRRPVTSMSPTILTQDGSLRLALGGAGGPRIPTMVVQILMNVLDDMPLSTAMQHPRLHHQYVPDQVACEPGVAAEAVTALQQAGFRVSTQRALGIGSAIKWIASNDELSACLDPRFGAIA